MARGCPWVVRRRNLPPMGMIERSIECSGPHGLHRVAYCDWAGPLADSPVVLCLHGLTRNSRDFDLLAEVISADFRVICPDMPGRGKSDWLSDPMDYAFSVYLSDIRVLLSALPVDKIDLVGTSMGGNLGMLMAAEKGHRIRRLVMNDIGPLIAKKGLKRIRKYVGRDPSFRDLDELEAALRYVFAGFGDLGDSVWRAMAEHSMRRKPDGTLGLNYDPAIGVPFQQGRLRDIDLWAQYDAVDCPTLVLRGADSDILRAKDARAMTERGPRARLIEYPGIGHAPSLTTPEQIAAVREFLLA